MSPGVRNTAHRPIYVIVHKVANKVEKAAHRATKHVESVTKLRK
jgi:hypothetical protein